MEHVQEYWSTNQPIEADGQIFWSDWNGILHATDTTTHNDNWTADLGTTTAACGGVQGPDSSATVATVNGVSTVFIGGGTAQVEALNAATGQVLWNTQISTDPSAMHLEFADALRRQHLHRCGLLLAAAPTSEVS